ncbi:MAG: hypothetical protein KDK89_05830 [Alphaproteobacteria bacterium]|nr:hypothetical protein [Alphaproteobacteria bacterium]
MIAAHGDCGGEGGNLLANELARRVRLSKRYDEVVVGYMKAQPSIEEVAAHISSERIRLFPLFMSDGYYVREAIPNRLGIRDGIDALGHHVTIETPLGLLPELPGLLIQASLAVAANAGLQTNATTLLLVAHGSENSPHSAEMARDLRDRMAAENLFRDVVVSYLEEKPFFADQLMACPRPTIVLGLFAGGGMHATEDVRGAVAELGDPKVHIVEQLGGFAGIIEMAVAGLTRRDGA